MQVTIWTERLPPHFRWDPTNPIRGTEQFYVQTAQYFASVGVGVQVVYDGPAQIVSGVEYVPRNDQTKLADAVLLCNWTGEPIPSLRRLVQWTNFASWTPANTHPSADLVVLISEYARLRAGVDPADPTVIVCPHGIDKRIFNTDDAPAKRERQVVYSSSPDRGGTWLASVWPEVESSAGYRLVQTGYGKYSQHQVANLLRQSEFLDSSGDGRGVVLLGGCRGPSLRVQADLRSRRSPPRNGAIWERPPIQPSRLLGWAENCPDRPYVAFYGQTQRRPHPHLAGSLRFDFTRPGRSTQLRVTQRVSRRLGTRFALNPRNALIYWRYSAKRLLVAPRAMKDQTWIDYPCLYLYRARCKIGTFAYTDLHVVCRKIKHLAK